MLMQLTIKDQAMQIKKYGDEYVLAFPVGWTSLYWDLLTHLEYIILDTFYTTGKLTSRAIQFKKMTTQLNKDIFVNYSNNGWYSNIYQYYTNLKSLLSVNHIW